MVKMKFIPRAKTGGKRRGSSLVEVLIAVIVLVFVLLGMLAAVVIAKGEVYYKEFEEANQVAIRILEIFEATPYENIVSKANEIDGTTLRGFTINVDLESTGLGDEYSRKVKVEVSPKDSMIRKSVVMEREVSVNGWQNVGELPD